MFIKLLGMLDILAAAAVLLETSAPHIILTIFASYLLIKGILFVKTGDLASSIDILIGIYVVFLNFGFAVLWLTVASCLFLVQKGFLSLL